MKEYLSPERVEPLFYKNTSRLVIISAEGYKVQGNQSLTNEEEKEIINEVNILKQRKEQFERKMQSFKNKYNIKL